MCLKRGQAAETTKFPLSYLLPEDRILFVVAIARAVLVMSNGPCAVPRDATCKQKWHGVSSAVTIAHKRNLLVTKASVGMEGTVHVFIYHPIFSLQQIIVALLFWRNLLPESKLRNLVTPVSHSVSSCKAERYAGLSYKHGSDLAKLTSKQISARVPFIWH